MGCCCCVYGAGGGFNCESRTKALVSGFCSGCSIVATDIVFGDDFKGFVPCDVESDENSSILFHFFIVIEFSKSSALNVKMSAAKNSLVSASP